MQELQYRFVKEGDNFDPKTLSHDEFNYYLNNLATARTLTDKRTVLYFDKRNYTVVKGYCNNNLNGKGDLISKRYYVEYFKQIAVKDRLIQKLKDEVKLEPKQVIFTNITTTSILGRRIAIEGDYDLMEVRPPSNIAKVYEDLIGIVESQDKFFPDFTFFREQLELIHKQESELYGKIPSSIYTLILWYHTFG